MIYQKQYGYLEFLSNLFLDKVVPGDWEDEDGDALKGVEGHEGHGHEGALWRRVTGSGELKTQITVVYSKSGLTILY